MKTEKPAQGSKRKAFPGQHDSESVELVFHQHPLVMRGALIIGLLALLFSMMPLLVWSNTSLVVNEGLYRFSLNVIWWTLILLAAYWFYTWIGWYYSVYILTNERLIEIRQRGFFNRKVTEFGLDKVQNVNYHIRGFQAVIFQYGDIVAQTYVGDLVMKTIHKPVQIHAQILDVVHKVDPTAPPGL